MRSVVLQCHHLGVLVPAHDYQEIFMWRTLNALMPGWETGNLIGVTCVCQDVYQVNMKLTR